VSDDGIGAPCRAACTAAITAGIGESAAPVGPEVEEGGASVGTGPVARVSVEVVSAEMDRRLTAATTTTSNTEVPHSTALIRIGLRSVACRIGFSIRA